MKDKRGLSTIVITLILIVLSLVAVGAVWLIVSNILKSSGQQATSSMGQMFISLEIQKVVQNASGDVNIIISRNTGAGELNSIKFVVSDGKNSTVIEKNTTMTELGSGSFTLSAAELGSMNVTEISIVPVVNSNGQKTLGTVSDTFKFTNSNPYSYNSTNNYSCSSTNYTYFCYGNISSRLDNCGIQQNLTCNSSQTCLTNVTRCGTGYSCSPTNYTYFCYGNISSRLDNCGIQQNLTCNSSQTCLTNVTRCGTNSTSNNSTNSTFYNSSLRLFYQFENNATRGENGTRVVSSTNYSYNGTVVGYGNVYWTSSGKYGGAYNFIGNNGSHIDLGDVFNFGSNPATICTWFKIASFANPNQYLIARITPSGTRTDYSLIVINSTNIGYSYDSPSDSNDVISNWVVPTIAIGSWHYFCLIMYNSTTVGTYYDGTSMGLTPTSHVDQNANVVYLGEGVLARYTGESNLNNLNGSLDEIKIWNRSLSYAEMQQAYTNSLYS
jgi:hypothetical protein